MEKEKTYVLGVMSRPEFYGDLPEEIGRPFRFHPIPEVKGLPEYLETMSFDGYIVDIGLFEKDYLSILQWIKQANHNLPVYALVPEGGEKILPKILKFIDFYSSVTASREEKAWILRHLLGRIQFNDLKKDLEFYRNLSNLDSLTELFNHRYFHDMVGAEINRSERYGSSFCIVMMDMDNFKFFNDTNGHIYGDRALKKLSHILKSNARASDVMARYGGDEFAILLPETTKRNTILMMDRIRRLLEREDFEGKDDQIFSMTASIGIAEYLKDGKDKDALITAADNALFEAKKNGGNQIWYHDEMGLTLASLDSV